MQARSRFRQHRWSDGDRRPSARATATTGRQAHSVFVLGPGGPTGGARLFARSRRFGAAIVVRQREGREQNEIKK